MKIKCKYRPFFLPALFLFALACLGTLAKAEAGAAIFAQGRTRLSVAAGYGVWNDKDYGIVGVGAGYYLMDGLEAGLDGEAWLGAKPHLYSVSPEVRYTFFNFESYKPYMGGFYKRSLYDTLRPLDSVGGRVGLAMPLGEHAYLSGGIVYEHYFNCNSSTYGTCSQTYPEIGLAFVY